MWEVNPETQTIKMTKGDTPLININLNVTENDTGLEVPYEPQEGDSIIFAVKQSKYDEEFILSIYLNNNVSDGVDITWIDTVNFELLNECRIRSIYVSGLRGEEMYARLLKAGIDSSRIIREPSCPALISALKESDCPVFILPTYTGMMATRSEIVKQCGGTEYWER